MSGRAGVKEDSLTLRVHDLRVRMMPGQIVRVADFSVLYDGDQEVTIFPLQWRCCGDSKPTEGETVKEVTA